MGSSNTNHEPRLGRRGRPIGSKNKPKPPLFITRDSPTTIRSHIIHISNGADISNTIASFARRIQCGVSILSASGGVTGITLRQPGAVLMTLPGRFEIISLSGTLLPGTSPPGDGWIAVYLAGGKGEVVGGRVDGEIVASGTVMVVVGAFANAAYERLPIEDEELPEMAEARTGSEGIKSVSEDSSLLLMEGINSMPMYTLLS